MSLDAPEPAPVPVAHPIPRRYVALGLVVVVVVLLGALVAIRDNRPQTNTPAVETFTPVPASVMEPLAQLPAGPVRTPAAYGAGPLTPLTATGSSTVWTTPDPAGTARPVVFFYGAEFAPYAGAERWPVIVALSRFGTFSSVGIMQSSSSVVFSDTPTFTFSHATYASRLVDLQTVERYSALNPTGGHYTTLQIPDRHQAAAVSAYDPTGSTFPLLDIANRYVLVGSSFSPSLLAGLSQSQVVTDLAIPTSPITQSVAASADAITAAICTVTGQRPGAVCQARGVTAAAVKLGVRPAGS